MAFKTETYKIRGMQQDSSESAHSDEFAYENLNVRILTNGNNTSLSVSQDIGNLVESNIYQVNNFGSPTPTIGVLTDIIVNSNYTPYMAAQPIAYIPYKVIGYCTIDKYVVLFGIDSLGYSHISRLEYQNGIWYLFEFFDNTVLGFDVDHPIETLANVETEQIKKVYFVDGVNELRAINVVNPNSYNNISNLVLGFHIGFDETMTVKKNYQTPGRFPSCKIQFAFRYFNQNESESNFVEWSPMFDCDEGDQGFNDSLDNTRTSANSFDISFTNLLYGEYQNIAIYYFIYPQLSTQSPTCYKVNRNISSASYNTNITFDEGDAIDATYEEVLSSGNSSIIPYTLASKDNFLICGNIKYALPKLIDLDAKELFDIKFFSHEIGSEYINDVVYQYNPKNTTFKGSNFDYMGYRRGNWYKFGIVCQYITGEWSEVIPLCIKQCNISSNSEIQYDDNNRISEIKYFIPQAMLIPNSSGVHTAAEREEFFQTLYDLGFRKILPVCVCPPSDAYRDVLTQGVVTPTMYIPSQRVNCVNDNTSQFAIPSYFFRPQPLSNPIKSIEYAEEYLSLNTGSSTAINSKGRFNDWWYYKRHLSNDADYASLQNVTPLYPYTIRNVNDIKTNITNVDSVNYNFTGNSSGIEDVITINNIYREFRNGYSLPTKDRINAECELSNVSLNDFCYSFDNDYESPFFSNQSNSSFCSQFAHSDPDFGFGCYYNYEYYSAIHGIGALWSDRHLVGSNANPTASMQDISYNQTMFIDESLCTLNSPEIDYLLSIPSISTVRYYLNSARIEICGYAQITASGTNLSNEDSGKTTNVTINLNEEQILAEPTNITGMNIFDITESENNSIYSYLIQNVKNIKGAKQQVIPFHSGPFWMDSNLTLALFGRRLEDGNTTYSRYTSHPDSNGGKAFGVTNDDIFDRDSNVSSSVDSRYTQLLFKIDAKGENTRYKLVPSWIGELETVNNGSNGRYRKTNNLHYTGSAMLYYDGVASGTSDTTLLYTLDYIFPDKDSATIYAIINTILTAGLGSSLELTTGATTGYLLWRSSFPPHGYTAKMSEWLGTNLGTSETYIEAFQSAWKTACLSLTPASVYYHPWKLRDSKNSETIIEMSSRDFVGTYYYSQSNINVGLMSYFLTADSTDIAGPTDQLNQDIGYNYSMFYYFWPYTKNTSIILCAYGALNANNSNYYWFRENADNKIRPTTDNMMMMVTYPRNPWNIYWNPYYYDSNLIPGVSGTEYVNGIPGPNPGDPPTVPPHPDLAIDPCEYGCHLYSPASMVFPNTLFEPKYLYGIYPIISHFENANLVYDIQFIGNNSSIVGNAFRLNETHTLLYSNVTNYFEPVNDNDIVSTNQIFYSNEQGFYDRIDYGIKNINTNLNLKVLYNFGQDGSSIKSSLSLPTVSLIAATKWYKGYLGYDNNQIENEQLSCIGNFLTGYNFIGDVAFSGLLPRLYLKSGRIRNMYLDKDDKVFSISDSDLNDDTYRIGKKITLKSGTADSLSLLKALLSEQGNRMVSLDHVPTDHIVFTSRYQDLNNKKILPPRFYNDSLINNTEPYTYKNIKYEYAYMFPEYYYKAIVDGILPEHPDDVPCRYDAAKMYHAFLYPHSVTWCPYPTSALRGNKQNGYEGMPYWEYAQKNDIEHHGWAARSLYNDISSLPETKIMKCDERGNARTNDNYWFLQIANVYNQTLRDEYNSKVNKNPYEYDSGVSVATWDWKACGNSIRIIDVLHAFDDYKENYNINYCEGDTFFVRYNCPKGYSKRASNSDAGNLMENDITDTASLMIESYINLDGQILKLMNIQNCNGTSNNILYPSRQEHQLWVNDCYSRWDSRIFHENDYNNPQSELDEYPTLIKWSLQKITGESIDSWGVFPSSNSYYAHGECGDVNKLLQFNNNVYCFQEHGVSILNFNPKSILSTDAGAPVTLAVLEEASRLQDLVYVSKDYGTFNKWSVIKTLSSIYFIDNTVKALCRIGSNGIEVLSTSKYMRDYFQDNINTQTVWTPEFSNDFTHIASFDIKNNNIYFTKKQDIQKKDSIAFDEMLDCFTSFYSYGSTQFMFNYKNSFYALRYDNTVLENEFKTYLYDQRPQDRNSAEYPKRIFGKKYNSSITLLVNPDFQYDKVFNFIEYYNDKYVLGKSLLSNDSTYSKIKVWNEYQDTGIVDTAGITNQKFRLWRTDIPRASKSRDRIRGQWCKIMLLGCPDDENAVKYDTDQIHMINVNYTIATQPMKTNVSQ